MSPCLDIAEFERCWPWIEAAVATEIGGAAYSKADVRKMIAEGEAQLWVLPCCATVTRIIETPACKFLQILWCGGKGRDLIRTVLPELEVWGALRGCAYVVGTGRRQWFATIKHNGFEEVARVYAKRLVKD